jgi:hypothetical protein
MKPFLVIMGIAFAAMALLGGAGENAGASQQPASEAFVQAQAIVHHGGDLFSSIALWEAETLHALVAQASPAMQAIMGLLLCLRGVFAIVGLYVVLTLRSVAGRVSHKVNGD